MTPVASVPDRGVVWEIRIAGDPAGSSIMPGKVNPVMCECDSVDAQVLGMTRPSHSRDLWRF